MDSANDILTRLDSAERVVNQKNFDQDPSFLSELVKSLKQDGWPAAAVVPNTIVRVAKVLRIWGKAWRDRKQDGKPLFDLAAEVLTKGTTLWPDDSALLNEQGTLYYETAQFHPAFTAFEKVIQKGSPVVDLGELVYAFENAAAALRGCRTGLTEVDESEFQRAQKLLTQGLNLNPANIKLLNEQGELYSEQEYYDKANKFFAQVLKHDPPPDREERVWALEGFAGTSSELGRFNDAEATFQEAFALSETPSANLLVEHGWLKFYQEQYELAFAEFDKALKRSAETSSEEGKYDARLGQITASHAVYALSEDAAVDKAESLIDTWFGQGLQPGRVMDLLFKCDSILAELNLYPAALRNSNLMLARPLQEREKEDPARAKEDKVKALRAKIDALKWLRSFDEAEEQYGQAQKEFPADIELWKLMANIHYQQKRFKQSNEYYSGQAISDAANAAQNNDEFRATLSGDEGANEWTIVTLRRMRKLPEAEKKVNEALASFGPKPSFLCEKAYIRFTQRRFDDAIALFDRALNLDEYYLFAHQWRAASYRKKLKFDKAQEKIDEARKKVRGDAGIWEERAWLAFDQNRLEEADEYFATAIKLDPYLIQKRFSRVIVLERLNRTDDAERILLELKKEFEGDPEVIEQLGWFYLRRHDLDHADTEFSLIEEDSVLGINGRGGYYLEAGEYALAGRAFCQALQKVKYEPQFHINQAWSLVRQLKQPGEIPESHRGRREQLIAAARNHCKEALALDPFDSPAHICLGVIAFKTGAYSDAEGYFRKSIEFSSVDGGRVELGALYVQMGRYAEAEKELAEAIRINKTDARGYIEMGNLMLLQDNSKEAVRQCRYAAAVAPDNDEAHRALAIALMRAGQYEEAEKALRKALFQVTPSKRWPLHLVLSQILIRLGDDKNKGDKNKEGQKQGAHFYGEALNHVYDALRLHASPNADVFFHAGIAHFKLDDLKASCQSFNDCLQADRDRFEADRQRRLIEEMIDHERRTLRIPRVGSVVLATLSVVMLLLIWTAYLSGLKRTIPVAEGNVAPIEARIKDAVEKAEASKNAAAKADQYTKAEQIAKAEAAKAEAAASATGSPQRDALTKVAEARKAEAKKAEEGAAHATKDKDAAAQSAAAALGGVTKPQEEVLVDRQMLTVYTPMLLGLFVIALLLPNLSKLKLFGGIEAEISEVKTEISSGPKGDVGFGSSMTIISPGPR